MTDLPGSVAPQTQGLILGPLHNSTLARTFVINAAEMEHTMHDDTMQFFLVLGVLLHSIAANRVETDKYITVDYRTLGIVKSDNVCIIIMGKVLAVDLNDFVIIAEHGPHLADGVTVESSHRAQPPRGIAAANLRERYAFGVVCYHFMYLTVSSFNHLTAVRVPARLHDGCQSRQSIQKNRDWYRRAMAADFRPSQNDCGPDADKPSQWLRGHVVCA